jgi:hypothetical protein
MAPRDSTHALQNSIHWPTVPFIQRDLWTFRDFIGQLHDPRFLPRLLAPPIAYSVLDTRPLILGLILSFDSFSGISFLPPQSNPPHFHLYRLFPPPYRLISVSKPAVPPESLTLINTYLPPIPVLVSLSSPFLTA